MTDTVLDLLDAPGPDRLGKAVVRSGHLRTGPVALDQVPTGIPEICCHNFRENPAGMLVFAVNVLPGC